MCVCVLRFLLMSHTLDANPVPHQPLVSQMYTNGNRTNCAPMRWTLSMHLSVMRCCMQCFAHFSLARLDSHKVAFWSPCLSRSTVATLLGTLCSSQLFRCFVWAKHTRCAPVQLCSWTGFFALLCCAVNGSVRDWHSSDITFACRVLILACSHLLSQHCEQHSASTDALAHRGLCMGGLSHGCRTSRLYTSLICNASCACIYKVMRSENR